jgi:anti-anti-sigma regulatory factor
VVTDRLVVLCGLDIEARREFIASASGEIDKVEGQINLDCARLDALDKQTLGMLVTVARFAQRRGQRVVLDLPSERVRHDLDDAGVSYLFAWSV